MSKGENIARLGFFIHDKVKRTQIVTVLKSLMESQFWSEDEMHQYRLLKLQRLIDHAYNNVPYYRDLFTKNDIHPTDIKSLDDIKKIPVLTKEIARENQKRLLAENISMNNIKVGKTGGTTGAPLEIFKDTNDRSFAWASYYRWYSWLGIRKEEKVLTLWGTGRVIKIPLKNRIQDYLSTRLENNIVLDAFSMSNRNIDSYYQKVIKTDPVLLKGYFSALIMLAGYMKDNNLPPNKNLKAVCGTSETILPFHRELLQNTFKVPVYDQYGSGEASAIAYECPAHKGLHVNEEHVIVECLDINGNTLIDAPGRVVVTALDNYIMPIIRYDNGDIASLYSGECTCGVKSHLMSHIDGRTFDVITLKDGSKANGVFFSNLFYEVDITTKMINRFQVFQHKNGSVDFLLETTNGIPSSALERLRSSLQIFFDNFTITQVPFIPSEENGKFKYIKTELP